MSVRSRPSVFGVVRIWDSVRVVPSPNQVSGYSPLDDLASVEPQRPPRNTHLSGRGRGPVQLSTMWAKHIRTVDGRVDPVNPFTSLFVLPYTDQKEEKKDIKFETELNERLRPRTLVRLLSFRDAISSIEFAF